MSRQSRLRVIRRSIETFDHFLYRPRRIVEATHVNKGKVYPYNSTKRGHARRPTPKKWWPFGRVAAA
jgi:hypothetical protein